MPTSAAVLTSVCARSVRRWSSDGPSETANRSTISTRPSRRANVSGVSDPCAIRAACSRSTASQTWSNAPSSSSSRPSSASDRPPPDSTTSASLDSVVPATTTLGTGTPRVPASRVTNPSCSTCCWRVSATGAAPRYQTERHRRDSSWVSRASRPWTLTTIGRPSASSPSTRSTPLGWRAASCRSVASRSICASAAATSASEGRPTLEPSTRWTAEAAAIAVSSESSAPVGVVEPSITTDQAAPQTHHRPNRRKGSDRCGAAANETPAPSASTARGTEPVDPPVSTSDTLGQVPSSRRWTAMATPTAAAEVSTTSTSTSPRRRTNAVTTTTSAHSSSAAAPRRHSTSNVEGTSSMTPISACSNPDGGTATAARRTPDTSETTSSSTSDPDRSRRPPDAAAKNGTPLVAGRHSGRWAVLTRPP